MTNNDFNKFSMLKDSESSASDSTTPGSEMPIPEEIKIWIEERVKDWSFETNKNIARVIATDLFRHLSTSKPKEGESGVLRKGIVGWVNAKERLPRGNALMRYAPMGCELGWEYIVKPRGEIAFFAKDVNKFDVQWLDESAPSTDSLEKGVKEEDADKYNSSLIEQLKVHLKESNNRANKLDFELCERDQEIAQLKADKESLFKDAEYWTNQFEEKRKEAADYRKALEEIRTVPSWARADNIILSVFAKYPKPITPNNDKP